MLSLAVAAILLVIAIAAWMADMRKLAIPLVVVLFALVFFLGRRIETGRDADWGQVAPQVQGNLLGGVNNALLGMFGARTPWREWGSDGELQCLRAIDGSAAQPPFALLHIRYSERVRRGEEHPDTWYDVSVAAVRMGDGSGDDPLQQVQVPAGYQAVHNGRWLFTWAIGGPGAGRMLPASQLPQLLQHAQQAARQVRRPGP